jgi:sec-independent protein translocase protein TatA
MGGLSFWHILLLAVVVLVLFGGRGRFSDLMGDFAKGIKNFKKGMAEEDTPPAAPPRVLPREEHETVRDPDHDKAAH